MPVSIYEWEKTVSGWDWIEVTENKVINLILRELNNLIKINSNNEVYVDLQLDDNLQSTATIPVWVNVWRVLQANGFPATWTLITAKTTSWDTVKVLYWDDGEIRVDNGTGTWKILQYKLTAGEGIEIWDKIDYSAMRWPCPEWYHVPSKDEWNNLNWVLTTTLGLASYHTTLEDYLLMPRAGYRSRQSANVNSTGYWGYYRSSTAGIGSNARYFRSPNVGAIVTATEYRSIGCSIRPFKDTPVVPTSSWTTLYDWSSIASWAWVFHNATDWLISVSWDGTTWTTIADKNLWATSTDITSTDSYGYYYQRWNNYWFPTTWTVTTSDVAVDTTGYWPWNYYSSDVYIISKTNWSSIQNNNLRWWETWVVTVDNVITNTWVLSVNWQTGDVTVSSTPWVTYITWAPEWNEYYVAEWDFKDGDLVLIDCINGTEPTTSIVIQWTTYYINGYDGNNWWNWSS